MLLVEELEGHHLLTLRKLESVALGADNSHRYGSVPHISHTTPRGGHRATLHVVTRRDEHPIGADELDEIIVYRRWVNPLKTIHNLRRYYFAHN
jgi:hypothetical protein